MFKDFCFKGFFIYRNTFHDFDRCTQASNTPKSFSVMEAGKLMILSLFEVTGFDNVGRCFKYDLYKRKNVL